jgi:methylthioribose-1-phosphate isomerase
MRTIDWAGGDIVIVDQTVLPRDLVMLRLHTVDELVSAIRRLSVRGAMALGVAGALGVALAAARARETGADPETALARAAAELVGARPTAVNLGWGVARAMAVRAGGPDAILATALRVLADDIAANHAIGLRGAGLLAGSRRLLTHCNAGGLAGVEEGTALSVIAALHAVAPLDEVYVCETRPLLQGARLTTWELARMGVPHRLIVDGAAAGLIVGGRVDAVVVGADRIAANGDVANKVGTLAHALAARRAGIPFVVAAPESTIDPDTARGSDIEIEERSAAEVLGFGGTPTAAPGTPAANPAFDVTPADLVSAIVTEDRTIDPSRDRIVAVLAASRPG